jgi:hypothetical protein
MKSLENPEMISEITLYIRKSSKPVKVEWGACSEGNCHARVPNKAIFNATKQLPDEFLNTDTLRSILFFENYSKKYKLVFKLKDVTSLYQTVRLVLSKGILKTPAVQIKRKDNIEIIKFSHLSKLTTNHQLLKVTSNS